MSKLPKFSGFHANEISPLEQVCLAPLTYSNHNGTCPPMVASGRPNLNPLSSVVWPLTLKQWEEVQITMHVQHTCNVHCASKVKFSYRAVMPLSRRINKSTEFGVASSKFHEFWESHAYKVFPLWRVILADMCHRQTSGSKISRIRRKNIKIQDLQDPTAKITWSRSEISRIWQNKNSEWRIPGFHCKNKDPGSPGSHNDTKTHDPKFPGSHKRSKSKDPIPIGSHKKMKI